MIDFYKVLEIENHTATKKLIKEKYQRLKKSIATEYDMGEINPKEQKEETAKSFTRFGK